MDENSSSTRRYNIFLSHSVRQKDFVMQLSVDLEKENQFAFSERRPDNLQKGESYASLIQQVARQCSIVVIVLSKDYIFSKWAMVELSAFVQFQKTENPDLKLLPLFYHFLPSDLSEEHLSKEHWEELVEGDETINIALWIQAVGVLRSTGGLVFDGNSEDQFRSDVVSAIINITRPLLTDGTSSIQGPHCSSKIVLFMLEKEHSAIKKPGIKFLGVYGLGGVGMAKMCNAFCYQFQSDFQGRNNLVVLSKHALRTLTGLGEAIVDQIHLKPTLSFRNEEQEDLTRCLQEWSFPNDNSPPKQYHVVALKGLEALLYANHKDINLSHFSWVSQNVYVLPLLQGSRDILASSRNKVPQALRLMDVEDPDKTWLVKFNTSGGGSESNQLNINRHIVLGKRDFDLAVQSIIQAMTICERMLEDLRLGHKTVTVYCSQWQYLVNALSTRTVEQFTPYHSTIEMIKGLVPRGRDGDPEAGIKVLAFCIQSLVELAQSLEQGLVLLSTCSRKDWWRTVLRMPNVIPDPKKGQRNSFCVVLQQCEWSLDLVKLAFGIIKEHFISSHGMTSKPLSFKWSNVKHRLFFIDGHDSHVEDLYKKSLVEVEKKDSTALIESLNNILQKFKPKWWWVANVKRQEQKIISFLKMKLEGPAPHPTYASYSTQFNHEDLIFKEFVGKGSFGSVLKMEWMGEVVAVKYIKNIRRKFFEAEVAILATVQHPNILHLIGCSFVEKDATGMIMTELMEGDLRDLINCRNGPDKVGPFPVIVAIDIMLQVAEAMQHLRECRILHRDLKAANILVSRRRYPCETTMSRKKEAVCKEVKQWLFSGKDNQFVVKLADFGVAKYQAQTTRFETKMAGTWAWRAPEVFKDDISSTEYKWPADVYSFGVTCFEILTGGMPFEGVSPNQIYEKIKLGVRPSIDSSFPISVTRLIKRCWATDPLDRPIFSQICKDLWLCKLEQFGLEVCAN